MSWLDNTIDSMDMNLSKVQEVVKDRKPGVLQSMGLLRVRHKLATEQQQQILSESRESKTPNYLQILSIKVY